MPYSILLNTEPSIRDFAPIARLFIAALIVFSFGVAATTTLMNLYLDAAGFDRAFIGAWQAASQLGALLLAPIAMLVFDRVGRKGALWIGAAVWILLRSFSVISLRPEIILLTEAASGFGNDLFGLASVSLLADISSQHERASLFSLSDSLRTLAYLLGSLIFGGLPAIIAPFLIRPDATTEAYQLVLIASFALRLFGVVPLLLIACHPRPLPPAHTERAIIRYLDVRLLIRQRPQVYTLAIPISFACIADSLIFPFFNLFLRDRFGISDASIGAVLGIRGLMTGTALLFTPIVVRRFGYRNGVMAGLIALTLAYILIVLGQSALFIVAASFAQAALFGVAVMMCRIFIINSSTRAELLLVSTALAVAINSGPAVGPLISGVVQQMFGFDPLFALGGLLMLCSVGLFWIVTRSFR